MRWERRAIARMEAAQQTTTTLMLTLRSPSGTLGMGVATQVTMREVVITPLKVTPSLASEPEPPPLPGTLIGTLLWSGMSVMALTSRSTW
jgi:hypothetical protein